MEESLRWDLPDLARLSLIFGSLSEVGYIISLLYDLVINNHHLDTSCLLSLQATGGLFGCGCVCVYVPCARAKIGFLGA